MKSVAMKVSQIDGLRGTKDVSPWEDEFIGSVVERLTKNGNDSRCLSPKQVEVVERIWGKHFA